MASNEPSSSSNPKPAELRAKTREEGEISSSDNDENALWSTAEPIAMIKPSAPVGPIQVPPLGKNAQGSLAGKDVSGSNVKPSNGKSFEKSHLPLKYTKPGWHAPSGGNNNLVISFSDNDSASESEDNRQEMASGIKRNKVTLNGNQRQPLLSSAKTGNLHKNARLVNKVMPKKLSLNRKFVSSISRTNRFANSKGNGSSSVEQGSRIRNIYTINKTTANQLCGSDQGTGLDNMKLQDLRQQIALRERELKIRATRQTRDSVSVSARDQGAVNLCCDKSKKSVLMAADAAVLNPREPEKKRLKVSGSYSTQLNLDYLPGRFIEKSTIPAQKEALANSNLVDRNIPDCSKKAIPISRVQSSMVKPQNQDDSQPVISPQDLTCSNINDICSRSIRTGLQVDPSVTLSQATPLTYMNSSTLPKNINSVQSNDLIKSGKQHPPGFFLKTSTSEQKLNINSEYCDGLCGNTRHQPSMNKICLASPNNVSQQNFLGSMNAAEHRRDIRSLVEMEESLDKELEEAQENRRKCEIEERDALKAYRRAQRDLIEANALCTELYHKRELYSAQFRSFVINDSSLLWSSRQHEYVGMASNIPNNASKNLDLVLNSSHQMQPESDGCSQPANDTSMHYVSGAPLHTSYQHMNGQNLASEPCSEPDASMSEPLPRNSNNGANRESIPSNDPNISAEEDEETSPLDNELVQPNFKNKQTGQHSLGEQRESDKLNNSIDGSQDSLILEATLRSELFARLQMRTKMKNSGLSDVGTADNLGTENDNGSERTQASNSSLPFSEAEKNHEYDMEDNDKAKRDQSEVPFLVQSHEMDSVQSYPTANSEGGGYSIGGYQLKTAAVLCPPLVVRSVFGCIKEMFPMNPFGLQRVKNKHDNPSDNYLEDGVCFNSQEIQCRKGTDNSVEETVREICGQEIGSYSYNAAIDPSWPLCMYELRGKCNNDDCPWQHARDFFNQNVDRHQSEFTSADCQVGLASCSQEHDDAKGPSKFHCALTQPTYLVGLDTLKAEPYSCESIVPMKKGQFWKKFFSICLASSSLPQVDLAADEPFSNGHDSRIEVHRSWDRRSSFFQNRNSMVDHVSQVVPSNVQSLEMALLILNQEVNNLESVKKCLSVLSRAIEVDPTSEILWIVYLLTCYSLNVSIGKDDMFSYAVKHNKTSYVLWLLYINSRVQFDDRFVAYNDALAALLHWAAAFDRVEMHASACILDLFLQMMDCLCMSGNVGKAIQKISKLLPEETDSDEPHSSLLSDILTCLVISDGYIFWVCCVYLVMYRKLPDAVVHQFECEKELTEIEWPPVHLPDEEKQRVLKLIDIAVHAVKANVGSELSNSETNLSLVQNFALCHIRCVMALDGLEHCQALLEKYLKLYPHCIEFVLISARFHASDSGGSGVKAFEEALSKWPKEVPGIHCIWNQYIEFSLERGGPDFAKELIMRWIDFVSKVPHTRNKGLDALTSNRPDGSFESGSASSPDLLVANSSQMDIMFGYLNLSLAKLMDKDLVEARFAIDRALRASTLQYIKYCLREYAVFFLAYKSQLVRVSSISEQLSILNEYLDDVQAFCVSEPLSRQFINGIEKPRVKQHVCNLLTPVSSDSFTVNLVLREWYGPSLLPQKLGQPKELVDFVEAVLEIVPSNYQLVFSVFKWLSRDGKHVDVSLDSIFFWASSALVNAICCAVPIAPEYVWAEAASILLDIPGIDSLSKNFYRRALSAYPFSSKLWNSYHTLSKKTREDASAVMEAARKRGIELGLSFSY